jgi:hypothetical protein
MIVFDEHSADITLLSALVSEPQTNALVFIMEKLLGQQEQTDKTLLDLAQELAERLNDPEIIHVILPFNFKIEQWFEAVRPIDVFCCANRMRGLTFGKTAEQTGE